MVDLLTWWLAASVNSEKMTYARQMLRGDDAARGHPLRHVRDLSRHVAQGKWLERPEDKEGTDLLLVC